MTSPERHASFEGDLEAFDPLYLVTLDELYHSHWAARKKRRIALMREAVAAFWPKGHPTRLIHVTGTNGKGSVSHYLEQGLRLAGVAGSWTGPHVFDYAERFHINGESVDRAEIVAIYRDALEPCQRRLTTERPGESLSFAEQGVLLALHLFERRGAAWGVMEVGAGGRYTPLMALDMSACVLTNIGDDHPKTLGAAVWQRALEKAGIARPGKPFFTAAEGEALAYVGKTAAAQGAEVVSLSDEEIRAVHRIDPSRPDYQCRNLALACAAIRHFYPNARHDALLARMNAGLPGRFSRLADNVIADIAHNPDKVARLAEHLAMAYPGRRFCFLVGLTRHRDPRAVFAPLAPLAKRMTATGASYPGQDPESLAAGLRELFGAVEAIADPREAYRRELARLGDGDILVLTGSAYMIDQALNPDPYVRHLNASYGWRTEDKSHRH